ncbi:hypothetical protein [Pseudomonas sp. S37]|uniref:hypothetical protein n=1 Tax=Pseudomonas sp. S37 TaxID=2767449 RepID=UPI0019140EEC|nr:hypothetical protein [Pseudomonas sp. S37]
MSKQNAGLTEHANVAGYRKKSDAPSKSKVHNTNVSISKSGQEKRSRSNDMHADFLESQEKYKLLENYFFKIFIEETKSQGLSLAEFKTPHYSAHFANGTPFMDGNPIFSAKNIATGNILRIVITDDVSKYAKNHNTIDNFEELCIVMRISELNLVQQDISSWIDQQAQESS